MDWNQIGAFAIEPARGKATFLIDNVQLSGPSGKMLPIFNTIDDGIFVPASTREPMQKMPPVGTVYLPFAADKMLGDDTPLKFKKLFGLFGTTIGGGDVDTVRRMRAAGIPTIYYSGFASGYEKFITKRGGWDEGINGASPNTTPFSQGNFLHYHSIAHAHPAVNELARRHTDALQKLGVSTWIAIDYTMPWLGNMGYAPAMIEAYRKNLLGLHQGLHMRDGAKKSV